MQSNIDYNWWKLELEAAGIDYPVCGNISIRTNRAAVTWLALLRRGMALSRPALVASTSLDSLTDTRCSRMLLHSALSIIYLHSFLSHYFSFQLHPQEFGCPLNYGVISPHETKKLCLWIVKLFKIKLIPLMNFNNSKSYLTPDNIMTFKKVNAPQGI